MSELAKIPADLKKKWDDKAALYEEKRAAMLPILRLTQEHYGFISAESEHAIAEYMGITPIHVREVVTFYDEFHNEKQGKNHIWLCHTLSCSLMGCDKMLEYLEQKLGIKAGETTPDGKFTLEKAECLGACEIAPMMRVNKDFYGPLTEKKIDEVLDKM